MSNQRLPDEGLLRVAHLSKRNTQQTSPDRATGRATATQQPSLKALALQALARNKPRNNGDARTKIYAQQPTTTAVAFVARVAFPKSATAQQARQPCPPVTCGDCQHFTPDTINPPAGMGSCGSGHGIHYPMQRRVCATFLPDKEPIEKVSVKVSDGNLKNTRWRDDDETATPVR